MLLSDNTPGDTGSVSPPSCDTGSVSPPSCDTASVSPPSCDTGSVSPLPFLAGVCRGSSRNHSCYSVHDCQCLQCSYHYWQGVYMWMQIWMNTDPILDLLTEKASLSTFTRGTLLEALHNLLQFDCAPFYSVLASSLINVSKKGEGH